MSHRTASRILPKARENGVAAALQLARNLNKDTMERKYNHLPSPAK
jgi:hypothetical protein